MPNLLLTMWDTIKSSNIGILVAAGLGMFAVIGGLSMLSYHYTLSGIKSRTVGDGQHGTARWATDKEIRQIYAHVPFNVKDWRKGISLPTEQGLVLGCKGRKDELTALVDSDDIHCLMIAASGAGKTAFFLYPNLEYACASGMSFLALDTKGDLARNYGSIAKKYYGYKHISVIDLRNPTRSDGSLSMSSWKRERPRAPRAGSSRSCTSLNTDTMCRRSSGCSSSGGRNSASSKIVEDSKPSAAS